MAKEKLKGLWFSYFILAVEVMFAAACILLYVIKNSNTMAPSFQVEAKQWMRSAIFAVLTAGASFVTFMLSKKNKTLFAACFAVISFGFAVAFVRTGAVYKIISYVPFLDDIRFWSVRWSIRIAGFRYTVIDVFTLLLVAVANIMPLRIGRILNIIKDEYKNYKEQAAMLKEQKQQEMARSAQKAAEFEAELQQENASELYVIDRAAYCELFKHALLLLLTCGIWNYIWIYRTTRYLNCVKDEEYRAPTQKLLLCIFVPFYSLYWLYKSALRVDKLAVQRGCMFGISTICLICGLFISIIPSILIQDRINAIITGKIRAAGNSVATSINANVDTIEKLAKLHQQGVLSDEEFQQKKTTLLAKI